MAVLDSDPCGYRERNLGCPWAKGPRAGDLVIVGFGGDTPTVALDKLLARRDNPALPAPYPPADFAIGEVTRAPSGVVVEYRDADGKRHPVEIGKEGVCVWRYAQRDTLRRGTVDGVIAAVSRAGSYEEAIERILTASRPRRRRCGHTHP